MKGSFYGGKDSAATVNNDVRFINVKIGVQRRKSRDGVMVSTSARQAGGPWFDSRSRRDRFLNAYLCFFILFPALCFTLSLI